ncbi:MAG: hemerythrin domain-containing protein [Actinomycetota bacterium]
MDTVAGSARELAEFRPGSFTPKVLFESERVKVVLAALEPGQEIPLHAPAVDVSIAVLEGTGDLWVNGDARSAAAGDLAVIPAGTTRGVRAGGGRMLLLLTVSPPPGAEDHAAERRPWPAAAPRPDVEGAIHEEHRAFLSHLDHLLDLAEAVPDLDEGDLRERLESVLGFLKGTLLPHAEAEERILYPAVDRLLRATGGGTRTMSIDHREIGERIEALAARAGSSLAPPDRAQIARSLVALEAIVRLHLLKEEEAYLPELAYLSGEEATALLEDLEATGGHDHHHHHHKP